MGISRIKDLTKRETLIIFCRRIWWYVDDAGGMSNVCTYNVLCYMTW